MSKARPVRAGRARGSAGAAGPPLGESDIDALRALLERVPAPLEPLDLSSLDGFLCGVLVQPKAIAPSRWLPFVGDVEGRPLPHGFDARRLHALVRRREAELRRAIERREWFDPWVFELAGDRTAEGAAPRAGDDDADDDAGALAAEAVLPWAVGFTAALETFPALLGSDDPGLIAPLALLYRHVGVDTLDDVEALRAEIETLAPPADLAEAVEELVRATLLLADVAGIGAER